GGRLVRERHPLRRRRPLPFPQALAQLPAAVRRPVETRTLVGRECVRGQRLRRASGRHQPIRERDERGQRLVARAGPGVHEARGLEEGRRTRHAREGERGEGRGGLWRSLSGPVPQRVLDGREPPVQLAAKQRERVSRRQKQLDADVDREAERRAPPQPEHELEHHLDAGRRDVGQDHGQAGGKAEGRSEGADRQGTLHEQPDEEIPGEEADAEPGGVEGQLQGEDRRAEADGKGDPAQDRPEDGGGGVLLRDQVDDHEGDQAVRHLKHLDERDDDQAGEGDAQRGRTPPRGVDELAPEEGEELSRAHRLAVRRVPRTVATAEAPSRKESSGSSTSMRTGKRAASRIQSSERSTRGRPPTLVPFSGRTAHPRPTTVPRKCLPGWDCKYSSAVAPAGMCRSCVSRKLATTYQVCVSTSVNTSEPARANAPWEMFVWRPWRVNGAMPRQWARSSSAECPAASAAARRAFMPSLSPMASSARARSVLACRSAASVAPCWARVALRAAAA